MMYYSSQSLSSLKSVWWTFKCW